MQVFSTLESIPETLFAQGSAVSIGKFDGVHLGHQQLLASADEMARVSSLVSVVMTFANNPLSYLRPDICPEPIMSRQQRLDALALSGAEVCIMVPFDAEMSQISAADFVTEILVKKLSVRHLVVGSDFRFGHRGLGDVALLIAMSETHGFTVEVVHDVQLADQARVSSSGVRAALHAGQVREAAQMLGRYPTMRGTVVHGDARGRELGYPTANLGGEIEGLRPADGVYAGWAVVHGTRYAAAISVGANVTFDPAGEPRVEAFLLDFTGDLYGATLEIHFVERVRDMVRFDGVDALLAQMSTDIVTTRALLTAEADHGVERN